MKNFDQRLKDILKAIIQSHIDLNVPIITGNYNGYRIVNPKGEGIFNSTILMYFLKKFTDNKKIPYGVVTGYDTGYNGKAGRDGIYHPAPYVCGEDTYRKRLQVLY